MQSSLRRAILVTLAALPLFGGTFGKVVSLRGNISDLAVDERRGVVYAANYTANRVEVVSMANQTPVTSYPVGKQPATLALSANQRFLVVGHNAPFEDPNTPFAAVTIIDLDANEQRVLSLTDESPLAVVFGNSNEALIVTTKGFYYLEPLSGALTPAEAIDSSTEPLPVEPGTYPGKILKASANVSGDGELAYILTQAGAQDGNWIIQYRPASKQISILGVVTVPALGPRAVSVDREGGRVLAGWGYLTPNPEYYLLGQVPQSTGNFVAGGHAFDARRDLIYAMAEVGEGGSTGSGGTQIVNKIPALHVMDTDNLTVRERIVLPQWLAGKSVFTSDYRMLFGISNSGLIALDLDQIGRAPRVVPTVENLIFKGNTCDRGMIVQTFDIVSPNADPADVMVSVPSNVRGIKITQSSTVTPATIRVEVDPLTYQNQQGTVVVPLTITSRTAVNIPDQVRLLINTKDFDQRGEILPVGGRIVDVLPDPYRGRFYVLRQDKNAVLVYNADTYDLIGTLRTGNTPTSIALTEEGRFLLAGNDNSQYVSVFDLDTLTRLEPVIFPLGQYPRSIAAGAGAIMATTRSASGPHRVFRINLGPRTVQEFDSLGIYKNDIDEDSVLSASPFGGTVMLAQASGALMLYEGASQTWVAARKDDGVQAAGAFAALSDDLFVIGNGVYDRSLVPLGTLGTGVGTPSGVGQIFGSSYLRTGALTSGPGAIERVSMDTLSGVRTARLTEAPLTEATKVVPPDGSLIGWVDSVFTRTLAVLPFPEKIVSTSLSGVTVLPYNYDAAIAMPSVNAVTNAADGTAALAPGSLIRIQGQNLAGSSASSGAPWPTALGEACVQVNGNPVPLTRVSREELLGQLPYTLGGGGALIVRNAGGVSGAFNLTLFQGAAAIFRDGKAGDQTSLATVVRAKNGQLVTPSNPIHAEDTLQIFVAGLGRVTPDVVAGTVAPDPAAKALIPAQVILAGEVLPQLSATLVPGQVGVYRIDVLVPWWIKTGNSLPLLVKQGSHETSLNVRVVGN